tara:strand:+ start:1699 stop:2427 length:729 start_codon:yes stop_codon:yes gene_type:complete
MFKQHISYKLTLIILFHLFLSNRSFAAKTLVCATSHYPPYTIFDQANNTFTGLDMAIIVPLFKQLNYDVKIVNLPWARLKKEIKNNHYDCYFSLAKFKYREELLEYLNIPTHTTKIAIFHQKSLKDINFKNKTVGVHRGINFHRDILALYGLQHADFHRLPSNETLFQMLHRKRVDAVVTSKAVGEYILKNQYKAFDIGVLDINEYRLPVYLAFKKGVLDINLVNKTLLAILNPPILPEPKL